MGSEKDMEDAVLAAVFGDDSQEQKAPTPQQALSGMDEVNAILDSAIKALDDGELYRGRQILIDLRARLARF